MGVGIKYSHSIDEKTEAEVAQGSVQPLGNSRAPGGWPGLLSELLFQATRGGSAGGDRTGHKAATNIIFPSFILYNRME